MKLSTQSIILLALMLLSAVVAVATRPTVFIADTRPKIDLVKIVPEQFDGWKESKQSYGLVVNPQEKEKLESLYTQLLSRTYVNTNGQRVMLSIAYGRDQRSYMAVHYPEVCYPAQGFSVTSNKADEFPFEGRSIAVRRLETALNKQRFEPVTYWTTIGEYRSLGGVLKRLIELEYGLKGKIPDGLLFRVSSIGQDSAAQFVIQQEFITALLTAIAPDQRVLLTGTGGV